MKRIPALSALLLIASCNSLAHHESMNEPLPPPAERSSIGAWKLDDSCTGAIQLAEGHYYWVNDCTSKFGHGWCDFGLRVEKTTPRKFVNVGKEWSFYINDDESLTETRKGRKVGEYAKSKTGICGVRITK
jgi:hypothetical protein